VDPADGAVAAPRLGVGCAPPQPIEISAQMNEIRGIGMGGILVKRGAKRQWHFASVDGN
jgi:hypothetical protein